MARQNNGEGFIDIIFTLIEMVFLLIGLIIQLSFSMFIIYFLMNCIYYFILLFPFSLGAVALFVMVAGNDIDSFVPKGKD